MSTCTVMHIRAYFQNGELPEPGTVCEPDFGVFVSSAGDIDEDEDEDEDDESAKKRRTDRLPGSDSSIEALREALLVAEKWDYYDGVFAPVPATSGPPLSARSPDIVAPRQAIPSYCTAIKSSTSTVCQTCSGGTPTATAIANPTFCPQCASGAQVTVYTTQLVSVCPTGLSTADYTITATCNGGCTAIPTGTAGGLTTTVVQCTACPTPGSVTITVPISPSSQYATRQSLVTTVTASATTVPASVVTSSGSTVTTPGSVVTVPGTVVAVPGSVVTNPFSVVSIPGSSIATAAAIPTNGTSSTGRPPGTMFTGTATTLGSFVYEFAAVWMVISFLLIM